MRTLLCHCIYMPCLSCSLLLNTVLSMFVQNAFVSLLRSQFFLTALKATRVKRLPFLVLPFVIFYFSCAHASIWPLSLLMKAKKVIKMFCNSCNKVQHIKKKKSHRKYYTSTFSSQFYHAIRKKMSPQ